jgi:VWFA-related protein
VRCLGLSVALASQNQQPPRFTATTDYVTTEVIARDSRGEFVQNLRAGDFQLLEDGVKQTITHFVRIGAGQVLPETPPAGRIGEGLIMPPAVDHVPGRLFVIFIDDKHIQPLDSIRARRVLNQVRDLLLRDGDLVSLVSTGFSSIATPLTYDAGRRRFDESVAKVLGSGMTPADVINASQTAQGPAGLRHDAHVAFKTAYDLLEQLARVKNRRKAFVYLSSGYDFNPFVNERFKNVQEMYAARQDGGLNPFEAGGQQVSEAELIGEVAALTRAAQRANVTFYTIDPRGLSAGPDINANIPFQSWRAYMETTTSTLKVLGDETGGFCVCNTNDLAGAIRNIHDAMSDYYVLGYTSSNSGKTNRRRTISISVTRPGVVTSGYRREYYVR